MAPITEVTPQGAAPLAGLKVLDLSPTPLGAQTTQTLADFGAEVISVEPPGGSPLRKSASFPFLARGKRSVTVDLRSAAGVAHVQELAATADVLVETFRPGRAERMGLGYENLSRANPRLVYTSITGFGRRGPWSDLKAYEGIVASVLGLQDSFSSAHAGTHPPFVSVPWCSFAASQTALHGILAALYEREDSGQGQWVETSLAQAVTTLDPWNWNLYLVSQQWPDAYSPQPAFSERGVPNSHMHFVFLTPQTRDGRWLQFAENSPKLFPAFMRHLGLEGLLSDPEWEGIPHVSEEERRARLWDLMLTAANQKTLGEWQEVMAADHYVQAELYRSGPEVLDHPQLAETGLVVEIDDPDRGRVRQPGPLVSMTATPATVGSPAPRPEASSQAAWWSAGRVATPRSTGTGVAVTSEAPKALPLEGITILELAVLYAAPYGATLLGDLGARVIKIEQIGGDPVRPMAGFPEAGSAKPTQGKESVAADVTTPEGREIVHRLAARCDAVLEGFRDGAADRLGIGPEQLLAINPDLVYLSAHGYGVGGPYGDRPAFAPSIGAAGGVGVAFLGDSVPSDPQECLEDIKRLSSHIRFSSTSRYVTTDGFGALGAASGLLLGLLARRRGAGGQHLYTSMLLTTAHALADHVVDFPGRPDPLRPGSDMRGPAALYRIYDAADGWIFLAAPKEGEWPGLVAALAGHVSLGADERFTTAQARRDHDGDLTSVLASVFAGDSAASWEKLLASHDVACVPVHTGDMEEVFMADGLGRASGYLADVEHPTLGPHPRMAPVVRFSRSLTQAKAGTLCGNATDSVLAELGYGDAEVAELRARGVIG